MLGRRSTLNTAQAEKDAEPVRRMLKFERDLAKQIKALMEQYQETQKELRLSPDNIHKVVEVALELAGRGHRVAVVSSGDPGVFAMASAVLEAATQPRYAAVEIASGKLNGSQGQTFTAGKLGSYTVGADKTVLLGPPFVFTPANIGQFNF